MNIKLSEVFSSLPVFVRVDASLNIKRMACIFSFVAVSTVAGFAPLIISNLYILVCVLSLLCVIVGGGISFNGVYVILYIAFGISALFANDPFFNSDMRFGLFVLVTLLCSPCIRTKKAVQFRCLVFRNILLLLSILTIGSFVCFFFGINLMQTGRNSIGALTAGLFGGLYNHSMLLGPLSALVAMVFLISYMVHHKMILIVLFFVSVSAVILSASRASVLALGIPILYLFLFVKNGSGSRKKLIGILVAACLISIPMVDNITSGLVQKQEMRKSESEGAFDSRDDKWNNRFKEFKENPIIGIGFCAVDNKNTGDYTEYGSVEPGSSHFAVLSMTGILGIIPYLLILFAAYKSVRKGGDGIATMRMCLFLIFMTHALFEGYVLFAGGFMSMMFWLVIGQCEDYQYMEEHNMLYNHNEER